jgi:hypothetical protein
LFNTASDVTVTGGGVTYDDIPVVSTATITATLTRIAAQLEAIATAYPGADKAWAKKELNGIVTRLEALETEYPGNDKAWVKAQKYTSLGYTPVNKAGDTGLGAMQMTTVRVMSAGGYISSDGSTGITTTITTASLVGKTITIKDGIITGFA